MKACNSPMYKAPKKATKKAPQKKSKLPKDLDFSKMKKVGNSSERASVDQQARSKKKTKK